MDILIIGNGFDLAHGLKTSYKDFLNFCKNIDNIDHDVNLCFKKCCQNNFWMKHFITRQNELGNTWIDLEKEIYSVIKNLSITSLLPEKEGNRGSFRITIQNSLLEFDLYNIKDYVKKTPREYPNGAYEIVSANDSFFSDFYFSDNKGFIRLLYEQLREFTKVFERYLNEEILSKLNNNSEYRLALKAAGVEEGSNDVYVLSFNYTDTCERLYKEKFNSYCCIDEIKSIYVHGKVNDANNCKLVLGTHSFENIDKGITVINIPIEFNAFKKHNQRHKYGTIEPYQDLIREIKYQEDQHENHPIFHIIGHSLDETDHNILKHILLANPNSIINVYYHDEEAQERLINNITNIIGEEEVMSKVRLIHQHNDERSILKRK